MTTHLDRVFDTSADAALRDALAEVDPIVLRFLAHRALRLDASAHGEDPSRVLPPDGVPLDLAIRGLVGWGGLAPDRDLPGRSRAKGEHGSLRSARAHGRLLAAVERKAALLARLVSWRQGCLRKAADRRLPRKVRRRARAGAARVLAEISRLR